MGNQGFRRTRKLCSAQHSSITRSRTPCFKRRIRSLTMRQRFTLLWTCSMRSRRWCNAWLAMCCSRVSSWPHGFLVGMRIATWGSVNARKPRSCHNWLPAGKGDGVASAMRLSWMRPPQVALRKRIVSSALTSRTFLSYGPFSCRSNMRPVQEGLGGGRCAVRSRHGQQGGRWRGGRYGASGYWGLLQRSTHRRCVGLRDAKSLGQGREGAGRGIAQGTQGREQRGEQDVNPLVGFALAHAEQAPLDYLEPVRRFLRKNLPLQDGDAGWTKISYLGN